MTQKGTKPVSNPQCDANCIDQKVQSGSTSVVSEICSNYGHRRWQNDCRNCRGLTECVLEILLTNQWKTVCGLCCKTVARVFVCNPSPEAQKGRQAEKKMQLHQTENLKIQLNDFVVQTFTYYVVVNSLRFTHQMEDLPTFSEYQFRTLFFVLLCLVDILVSVYFFFDFYKWHSGFFFQKFRIHWKESTTLF